jgi:spore maturation protein CgeB
MSFQSQRVLISYFFENDSIPLGFACMNAFKNLGFETRGFHAQTEHPAQRFIKPANKLLKTLLFRPVDLSQGTQWHNHTYRQAELRRAVAEFRPDLLLVIRGNSFDQRIISELKEEFAIRQCIGWWVKDPRSDDQMLRDAQIYDHYFCIHTHGYEPENEIHHLPALGVYRDLYYPLVQRTESNLNTDLVFVGGWSERREHFLQPLLGYDLKIFGPGWRKKKRLLNRSLMQRCAGSGVWGRPMVELYCRSRIVLNITSWDPGKLSGQNLRLLDVPATGAFLLTDAAPEVFEYFAPGVEIETFSSPEELLSKTRFYLANPAIREQIARRGYERTQSLPSYEDRMTTLLSKISWNHKG